MVAVSENEITKKIRALNGDQRQQLLDYIDRIRGRHSHRLYRRKAMRQIRQALNSDF